MDAAQMQQLFLRQQQQQQHQQRLAAAAAAAQQHQQLQAGQRPTTYSQQPQQTQFLQKQQQIPVSYAQAMGAGNVADWRQALAPDVRVAYTNLLVKSVESLGQYPDTRVHELASGFEARTWERSQSYAEYAKNIRQKCDEIGVKTGQPAAATSMQMGGGGMQTMQAASYGISVATSNAPQIMAQVQAAQMARSMPPGSMQHLAAGGVPMRPGGSVSQAQAQLLMAQQQQQQAGGRPVLQQQGLLTSVGQQQQQRPLLQQGTIDPHQYALSQIGPDITPQEGMMIANMTLASLKEHLEKNKLPMNSAQRAWNAKVTYDRAFAVAQESNARRAGQNIPQVPQQQPFQLRAPASMAQATPAVSQPFGTDPAQAQMLQPAAGVVARPRPPVAPEPVKTAVQQPARPAQPVPTAAGVIKRPVLTLDEGEQQYVRGKLESMKPMMQKAELMIGVLDSSTIPSDREAAKDCLQLMKVWQAQMELLPQNVFNFNPTSVEKLYNKMLHYTRTAEDRRRQMQQNGGVKTTRGSSQDPILVASPHSSVGGRPSGSYQFPASTQPEDASQVAPTIITESPEVAAVAIPTTKGGKKGKGKAAPNKKASATPTTATAATAAAPAAPPKSRGKRGSKSKAGTQDEPPLMSPDPAAGQPPATAAASPTLLAPKPKRSRGKSLATDAPAEQPATATSTAAAAAAAAKPNPTNAKTKAGAKTGAKAKQPATKTGSKSNAAPAGESAKPPSVLEAAALTASAGGVGGFSTTTAAAAQPQTATPTTAPITTVRTPSTKPDVDPHIQKAIENTYMNDFASFNTHPADPMAHLADFGMFISGRGMGDEFWGVDAWGGDAFGGIGMNQMGENQGEREEEVDPVATYTMYFGLHHGERRRDSHKCGHHDTASTAQDTQTATIHKRKRDEGEDVGEDDPLPSGPVHLAGGEAVPVF